jgi:hypothetical protein
MDMAAFVFIASTVYHRMCTRRLLNEVRRSCVVYVCVRVCVCVSGMLAQFHLIIYCR